jgi:hypothetical protein
LHAGGSLLFKDPPVDLAFDVIWVAGGEEFPAGRAMMTAGKKSHGYGIGGPIEGFTARSVDVILRPSVDAAVQSPEISRIWNGEIRIEGVAVEWPEGR